MADNATGLTAPSGLNHLVLNVRNMDESHAFWTDVVGLKQVGKLKARPDRPNPPNMQFYSCDHAGKDNHHDIALVENTSLPEPPKDWSMFGAPVAVNHIAIAFPTREAWLARLEYLQKQGVKFNRRVDHGMTHSLHQRSKRLRSRIAVRTAARSVGRRHRCRSELRPGPADRRSGSADRRS